jgi:hypothetical protein
MVFAWSPGVDVAYAAWPAAARLLGGNRSYLLNDFCRNRGFLLNTFGGNRRYLLNNLGVAWLRR